MAAPRYDASALGRAIVARLRQCAPSGSEWTTWLADQAGLPHWRVADLVGGGEPLTVELADLLLRTCCGQSLLDVAGEVDRVSRPPDRKAER